MALGYQSAWCNAGSGMRAAGTLSCYAMVNAVGWPQHWLRLHLTQVSLSPAGDLAHLGRCAKWVPPPHTHTQTSANSLPLALLLHTRSSSWAQDLRRLLHDPDLGRHVDLCCACMGDGSADPLLTCGGCPRAFHLACCGLTADRLPADGCPWLCQACTNPTANSSGAVPMQLQPHSTTALGQPGVTGEEGTAQHQEARLLGCAAWGEEGGAPAPAAQQETAVRVAAGSDAPRASVCAVGTGPPCTQQQQALQSDSRPPERAGLAVTAVPMQPLLVASSEGPGPDCLEPAPMERAHPDPDPHRVLLLPAGSAGGECTTHAAAAANKPAAQLTPQRGPPPSAGAASAGAAGHCMACGEPAGPNAPSATASVACATCAQVWHLPCMGLERTPQGAWMCHMCCDEVSTHGREGFQKGRQQAAAPCPSGLPPVYAPLAGFPAGQQSTHHHYLHGPSWTAGVPCALLPGG